MPVMNEWEKSKKLTGELKIDITTAAIRFCFQPLNDIFEELYIVLAWDLYFLQTPKKLYDMYIENKELMGHLVEVSETFQINDIPALPAFNRPRFNPHYSNKPNFPITLPMLATRSRRHSTHVFSAPEEGKNKKERAIYKRWLQLKKDIEVFSKKVNTFNKELTRALEACTTTKQFIEQNPEFEGYMKQALKKFYSDKHPNVIDSLNSAMDVRTYASLTSGHRLQAYQTSMLAQLEQLETRHTVVLDSTQV